MGLSNHSLKNLVLATSFVYLSCLLLFPKESMNTAFLYHKDTDEFLSFEEIAEINKSGGQKIYLTWANLLL